MVGQMYVEYFIPQTADARRYPIVMIHGGRQTGTNFTGTPDGREGWAQYFLRRGYAVYVVDQVARGRSAHFSQSQGRGAGAADLARTEQRFVAPKRFNLWPQAKRHTQWPGSGKPGDAAFDAFYATQFPSLDELSEAAGDQPRRRASRCSTRSARRSLLAHSQSGAFGWPIADARPKLVKAIVAIEPNGPPVYETDFKGAPDWFVDIGARKTWGLGMVPLDLRSAAQAAASNCRSCGRTSPMRRIWCAAGCRREPARKLPNLAKVPILIVVGGGVLSRGLRPLHRGLSRAGRRARTRSSGSPTSASAATAT